MHHGLRPALLGDGFEGCDAVAPVVGIEGLCATNEAELLEDVLRHPVRGFDHGQPVTKPSAVGQAGTDQVLPDAPPLEAFVHPKQEEVEDLTRGAGRGLVDLLSSGCPPGRRGGSWS